MKHEQYVNLIEKLDKLLCKDAEKPSVSPTQDSSGVGKAPTPDTFLLTGDTDVEQLSQSDLYLAHTLLHKFYGSGSKYITKTEIERLHCKIREKIPHTNFDRLDEK